MSERRFLAVLLAAALVTSLAAGCAGPRTVERQATEAESAAPQDPWSRWDKEGPYRLREMIADYFANRAYDLLDIFDVSITAGKWARLQADYGIGFWGFGALDCPRLRVGGRSFILNEESTTLSALPFPLSLVLAPFAFGGDDEIMTSILALGGISYEGEYAIWPDPVFSSLPAHRERIRIAAIERDPRTHRFVVTPDSFAVGAEMHLFLGARVRVMPLQVFDFLAGILGWNLMGDDIKPYRPRIE